jgi:CelD/BcsL family acetyltransferase involved in cellulose biosynthesis
MTLHVTPADWPTLSDAWTDLLRRTQPPAGPFVSPQFQSAWWEIFAADRTLNLLAVCDGPDLIGVLPLAERHGTVEFVGDFEICDYMDLLAAPGREPDVLAALLDHLDHRQIARADLRGLAHGSTTLTHLPALAQARGWTVDTSQEAVCPTVPLAADWDTYLAGLKKKYRHEIRRKMRHLLDGGAQVSLAVFDEPQDILDRLPEFLRLMTDSRGDKADFMTDQMATFFHTLISRLAPQRLARLYFLTVDGACAAAVLGFVEEHTLLLYNSGYDPDYRDLSVGIASKVFVLRDSIDRGLQSVNFLRGDEDYKFQLGGQPSPVTRLQLSRA